MLLFPYHQCPIVAAEQNKDKVKKGNVDPRFYIMDNVYVCFL